MKKTYEKPQIYMERFELAEHIAGCNLTMNSQDEGTCTATGTVNGQEVVLFAVGVFDPCQTSAEAFCITNGSFNLATINS